VRSSSIIVGYVACFPVAVGCGKGALIAVEGVDREGYESAVCESKCNQASLWEPVSDFLDVSVWCTLVEEKKMVSRGHVCSLKRRDPSLPSH
jgi:hypothetical protein